MGNIHFQNATALNAAFKNTIGENATVLEENLVGIVDNGRKVLDLGKKDEFVGELIQHIAKVEINDEVYTGTAPDIRELEMTWGGVIESIRVEMPDAVANPSYELTDGKQFCHTFHKPKVSVKFFSHADTYELEWSLPLKQLNSCFDGPDQANSFVNALRSVVISKKNELMDELTMRCIDNAIANVILSEYPEADYETKASGVRAVNLLKKFKEEINPETTLTPENCLTDFEFLRFATSEISMYPKRFQRVTKLLNVDKVPQWTPKDRVKTILLDQFAQKSKAYLRADVRNRDEVELPEYSTVACWQGIGDNFKFSNVSDINLVPATEDKGKGDVLVQAPVHVAGVLGIMYDDRCMRVRQEDVRVYSTFVQQAEFYDCVMKVDAGRYNNMVYNCVVFFVA